MGRLDFLTDDQRTAVYNRGGALLVAAAAGSGKTRVLVERLLERICDPDEDRNIDDFLIITYTNAAAAELRGKIMEGISARLADEPSNRRLRRQQMLCHRAHIGTIHSFCSSVLRENAQLAGLSPDFRVADESESNLLRQRAVEELLDGCYENMRPEFAQLLDTMSAGQDDSKLSALILETYTALQSHPYPADWCAQQTQLMRLEGIDDLSRTLWGQELMGYARTRAKYLLGRLEKIQDDCCMDEMYQKAYAPSVTESAAALAQLLSALDHSWDAAFAAAQIPFPRVGPLRGEGYDDVKNTRAQVKKACEEFGRIFTAPSAPLIADMQKAAPATGELLRLVVEFTEHYSALKRRRSVIDFNDQEHLALAVLVDKDSGKPTALAREISQRFCEIMVDEYQDVNRVQEMLINSVSQDGRNLFMVGDVKQSIYRFRLADPSIFLEKYNTYPLSQDAQPGQPRKVLLSQNFRSRAQILNAANCLFSDIMSTELGEMEYTPAEYLYPGAKNYQPADAPCVQLCVLDTSTPDEDGAAGEDSPDRIALEADYIARRILELKRTMAVTEGEGTRPARWGDFAVLMRSVSGRSPVYAKIFAQHGIPLATGKGGSLFNAPEISFMLSFLSVIDNPRQDIPLISVLRSPVYGFDPDRLADIRLAGGSDFYEALVNRAADDEKCRAFVNALGQLRLTAPELSADRLIWHIYNVTDALGIYGAMPNGQQRRRNLMLLFEYARQFENNGFKGLFQFITNLRELMERGEELPAAEESANGDSVVMMSIHKSKGLEFPVVFMPDLRHRFNMSDTRRDMLLHRELGPGTKVIDSARRIRYDTVAHRAAARRIKAESLSEEMRILYVGMTRAKEHLIMTAAYPKAEKALDKLAAVSSSLPIDPGALCTGGSYADWVIPAVQLYGTGADHHYKRDDAADSSVWSFSVENLAGVAETAIVPEETADAPHAQADPALTDEISLRLAFRYPYTAMTDLPSKLAPTELKGRVTDEEAALEAGVAPKLAGARRRSGGEIRRPSFAADAPMTATQKGTAFHSFMQFADWSKCTDWDGAAAELTRLAQEGRLSEDEAQSVDIASVVRFFTSPEGRMVLAAPNVTREFKFSVLLPAAEFFPGAGDDQVLLQGVVDCCVERDDRLTIIDFKTDRVDEFTALDRADEYRGQLDAYALAMESISGKRVAGKILYFTRPGIAVYLG